MRTIIATLAVLLVSASAEAQLGGLLDKAIQHGDKLKKGAKVVQASRDFTEEEEADIGRIVAARILSTYPLVKNEKLHRYVSLVGNTVAAYSARPTLEWHFAVLKSPVVNAFSCPGGFIFITSGALEQMDSEAELAAVLGHEIAHATHKHILKEIKRANLMSAGADLAQTSFTGGGLTDELAKKLGDIAFEKLFTTGLSRRDEQEADKTGVQLAAEAGYRAAEYVKFLETLQDMEGTSSMKTLTATHPKPGDRVNYVKPLVADKSRGVVLAERWVKWTTQ